MTQFKRDSKIIQGIQKSLLLGMHNFQSSESPTIAQHCLLIVIVFKSKKSHRKFDSVCVCICYVFQIISNKYKAVQLNGDEFEQTPGDSEGQGSMECCSPWSRKVLDMTQQLNKNNHLVNSYYVKTSAKNFVYSTICNIFLVLNCLFHPDTHSLGFQLAIISR